MVDFHVRKLDFKERKIGILHVKHLNADSNQGKCNPGTLKWIIEFHVRVKHGLSVKNLHICGLIDKVPLVCG